MLNDDLDLEDLQSWGTGVKGMKFPILDKVSERGRKMSLVSETFAHDAANQFARMIRQAHNWCGETDSELATKISLYFWNFAEWVIYPLYLAEMKEAMEEPRSLRDIWEDSSLDVPPSWSPKISNVENPIDRQLGYTGVNTDESELSEILCLI